jgi:hypothetical protein
VAARQWRRIGSGFALTSALRPSELIETGVHQVVDLIRLSQLKSSRAAR